MRRAEADGIFAHLLRHKTALFDVVNPTNVSGVVSLSITLYITLESAVLGTIPHIMTFHNASTGNFGVSGHTLCWNSGLAPCYVRALSSPGIAQCTCVCGSSGGGARHGVTTTGCASGLENHSLMTRLPYHCTEFHLALDSYGCRSRRSQKVSPELEAR